ncbi:MAG: cyclophilin-like fold protein [Candidatus Thorarchaeota archaeon]
MASRIPIEFIIGNEIILEGELRSILSPRTIDRILPIMPIKSRIHLWKSEIYFEIKIRMGSEKAVSTCEAGAIAYWPQGDAICVFFEEMTPYSKVNPIGQLTSVDFKDRFPQIKPGMPIIIRLLSEG